MEKTFSKEETALAWWESLPHSDVVSLYKDHSLIDPVTIKEIVSIWEDKKGEKPVGDSGVLNGIVMGKWYVGSQNTVRSHIEGKEIWEDEIICTYTGGNMTNANLIATAPKMYSLLTRMLAYKDEILLDTFKEIESALKAIESNTK